MSTRFGSNRVVWRLLSGSLCGQLALRSNSVYGDSWQHFGSYVPVREMACMASFQLHRTGVPPVTCVDLSSSPSRACASEQQCCKEITGTSRRRNAARIQCVASSHFRATVLYGDRPRISEQQCFMETDNSHFRATVLHGDRQLAFQSNSVA